MVSAVGHYTLNKANCGGEWMTQWLLENKLVALNTMYKKPPQKQVTYHTSKNVAKHLDYILVDRKHYSRSRDAEANDTIHMGSAHRCIMAKFDIPKEKGKPRHTKAPETHHENDEHEGENEKKKRTRARSQRGGTREKKDNSANEAKDPKEEAVQHEANLDEAVVRIESDASVAPAVAADGKAIKRRHAKASAGTAAAAEAQEATEKDEAIRALIQERKTIAKHEKERIREISKKIKKNIRGKKRTKRQKNTENHGRSQRNKKHPQYQVDEEANSHSKNKEQRRRNYQNETRYRKCICEILRRFVRRRRKSTEKGTNSSIEDDDEDHVQDNFIKEFTKSEIQDAIDRLKRGKAKDSNGIRAEQLKNCSDDTKEKIRTIFNEIAQQENFTPKSWRKIRIQVIYKKGDREDAGNYRPICSLPVLYKLFATVF